MSFLGKLLSLPVRLYRAVLSPLLPRVCRFHPSCSQYALDALERHSAHRALGLIFWRLCRCQPFAAGGIDPVPPALPSARRARVAE